MPARPDATADAAPAGALESLAAGPRWRRPALALGTVASAVATGLVLSSGGPVAVSAAPEPGADAATLVQPGLAVSAVERDRAVRPTRAPRMVEGPGAATVVDVASQVLGAVADGSGDLSAPLTGLFPSDNVPGGTSGGEFGGGGLGNGGGKGGNQGGSGGQSGGGLPSLPSLPTPGGASSGSGGGAGGGGPVGQVLDPVVDQVTGALDQASGGATAPVTGVVRDTVKGVTGAVDGLLGGAGGAGGDGGGLAGPLGGALTSALGGGLAGR